MADNQTTVLVALGSLVAGHLLSQWWNRARPFAVCNGFSEVTLGAYDVACGSELSQLTEQSFFIPSIRGSTARLEQIQVAHTTCLVHLKLTADADAQLKKVVALFDASSTDIDLSAAVEALLTYKGVADVLEVAAMRNRITFEGASATNDLPKLRVVESDENDGCFLVMFKETYSKLGSGLKVDKWRRDPLIPLVNAIAHLNKAVLCRCAIDLQTIIAKQRELHRNILDLTTPIVNANSQWAARCSVVNTGLSPMILLPKASLAVVGHNPKAKFAAVECYAALEVSLERAQSVRRLIGPRVVGTGAVLDVWIIASKKQKELPQGDLIRAIYEAGSAEARLTVTVRGRSWPFARWSVGTRVPFKEREE